MEQLLALLWSNKNQSSRCRSRQTDRPEFQWWKPEICLKNRGAFLWARWYNADQKIPAFGALRQRAKKISLGDGTRATRGHNSLWWWYRRSSTSHRHDANPLSDGTVCHWPPPPCNQPPPPWYRPLLLNSLKDGTVGHQPRRHEANSPSPSIPSSVNILIPFKAWLSETITVIVRPSVRPLVHW